MLINDPDRPACPHRAFVNPALLPLLATPALARRRLLVSSCRRECQHRPSGKRGGGDAARDVSYLLRAASLTPLAAATLVHRGSLDVTSALAVAWLLSSVPARSLSSRRPPPPFSIFLQRPLVGVAPPFTIILYTNLTYWIYSYRESIFSCQLQNKLFCSHLHLR
jgi:hypothetical protein